MRATTLSLIALLLTGCGGGGSDDTAVSATPPATVPPIAATPAPAPPLAPITPPVKPSPAPAPSPVAPPAQPPASNPPAVEPPAEAPPSVAGPLVWAALQRGLSDEPGSNNPYSTYRQVYSATGSAYYLGGRYSSHILMGGFGPSGGIGLWERVSVEPVASNGIIYAVQANGLTFSGPQVNLQVTDPLVDRTTATWTNGPWSVSLLIQSEPKNADLIRVCWNVNLPPPDLYDGPPEYVPPPRTVPFKRLMCGIYDRHSRGPDRGGHMGDDYGGVVTTYSATW